MLTALLASLLLTTAEVPPAMPVDYETLGVDASLRMTLPAKVNGEGPFPFTIDTGAARSVISDALAAHLNLPEAGRVTVFGIVGPQSVATVTLDRLRFGSREHRGIEAPVLPHRALGAQGFIGLDALAKESVLIDFRTKRISIARSAREAMVNDPDVIVVTGKSRFGQLILTDASIGRIKVYAVIDTGAENSIGNLALRKMLGRNGPLEDKGGRVVGVTGATLPAEAGIIRSIRFGSMRVNQMPIAYADLDTFRRFKLDDKPAILIGMDLLRTFQRVAVDFARRSVRFKFNEGVGVSIGNGTRIAGAKGTPPALGI